EAVYYKKQNELLKLQILFALEHRGLPDLLYQFLEELKPLKGVDDLVLDAMDLKTQLILHGKLPNEIVLKHLEELLNKVILLQDAQYGLVNSKTLNEKIRPIISNALQLCSNQLKAKWDEDILVAAFNFIEFNKY